MVKDTRQEFNYFGMKPFNTDRAAGFCSIFITAVISSIIIIPAILNSDLGISLGILLAVYVAVLEILFVGVCLFKKFELSANNVLLIKLVLLPFALLMAPLLLLLYFTIAMNLPEILAALLIWLKAVGLTLAIIIGIGMVLAFFIYFNVAIAEALGQKPAKKEK